ncbi:MULTISPECIES: hypothetical protein [unclassified Nonomuraea]|uniref:hypothetical protein n=1 Tax=unclassified Nonomuraea TaxID=2593643 RepID=UPI0033E3EAE4
MGVTYDAAGVRTVAAEAIRKAAQAKDKPADLIVDAAARAGPARLLVVDPVTRRSEYEGLKDVAQAALGDNMGADVSGGAGDQNHGLVLLRVGLQGFVPARGMW